MITAVMMMIMFFDYYKPVPQHLPRRRCSAIALSTFNSQVNPQVLNVPTTALAEVGILEALLIFHLHHVLDNLITFLDKSGLVAFPSVQVNLHL